MSTKPRSELPAKHNTGPLRSFAAAFAGVGTALMRERNLRIHTVAGAAVLMASRCYDFSRAERLLLLLFIGLVLCAELLNAAIEHAVDLASPALHPLARAAKDIAAGAVLVAALVSLVAGLWLFSEPAGRAALLAHLLAHPLLWGLGSLLALGWVILPGLTLNRKGMRTDDKD